MVLIEGVLAWLLKQILAYLASRAESAVQGHLDQNKQDQANGKIDDDNLKKYQDAKDRADRIRAAVDLLNGNAT